MSEKEIATDDISRFVNRLVLSERQNKNEYSDDFHSHLTSFLTFYLAAMPNQNYEKFEFDEANYIGLEQFILENSDVLEDQEEEIDWDLIDNAKDMLLIRLTELLGRSDHLKPFVRSSVDFYEKWLIYQMMHPRSVYNPWTQTLNILKKGYLFFRSDDKNRLTAYKKDIYKTADREVHANIGLVATNGKRNFSGFIVDNRHDLQLLALEYLDTHGSGRENAKSSKRIIEHVQRKGKSLTPNDLKSKVMAPLKKTGLIGSCSKGYFYISTIKDLEYSYETHLYELYGLQKTLKIYEKRAGFFGVQDLGKSMLANEG